MALKNFPFKVAHFRQPFLKSLSAILLLSIVSYSFQNSLISGHASTSLADWSELIPGGAPSARFWHAMAYDPDRNVTVMFGGLDGKDDNNQTWEFSGSTWVQRMPTYSPPANYGVALAYDSDRHEMLLFAQETYAWDGTNWTKKMSADNPPQASFSMMAYDSLRHVMVLFGGGSSTETWEWDGTDWTQHITTSAPSATKYGGMAYDEARGKIVFFGGENGQPFSDETWEYDGSTWMQRFPIVSPSQRYGHTMIYDPLINRVILFGGANTIDDYDDIWEWDASGNTWILRSPVGNKPEARAFGGMSYDSIHGVTIIFGGKIERETYKLFEDTWSWNSATNSWTNIIDPDGQTPSRFSAFAYDLGNQEGILFGGNTSVHGDAFIGETWIWNSSNGHWARYFPAHSPSPRATHTLAYDAGRNVTLLFGGYRSSIVGDMWEWDGTDWQQLFPEQIPSPRQYMDMVYDRQRDRVILFGGKFGGGNNDNYNDTWEWNGTNWTERFPVHSPSPRYRFKMAYDTVRHVTVLYGGIDNNDNHLHDTWEWDGTDWTQHTSSQTPFVSSEYGMVFDELRNVTVLFGGSGAQGEIRNETWEWDGTEWSQSTTLHAPLERLGPSMIYDATRKSVILFGGDSNTLLDDTWEYKTNVIYDFTGFFQPVDNIPTLNVTIAGRAIPVKFSLNGDHGLNIFESTYPRSQTIACDSTAPVDGIEETINAGSSSLSYNLNTDTYTYIWKTDKRWADTCRQLVVKLNDGTYHRANFKFRKQ